MDTKSIRLNIPEMVEEYLIAKTSRDTEECADIRQRLAKVIAASSEHIKAAMKCFIEKFLITKQLSNKKDLEGLFDSLLSAKKEV